jgi:gliding motility-associated-like protein
MTMAKGLNGSVYLQVSDIPLGFISNSGCVTDSNEIFATSRYLPFEETNLNWQNLFDHDVVSIALPQTIPANDFIMQSQIECQQQSLCNNIKLSGNNNLCFSDSAFVFSATKNSECLKKISWLADTTFVSSISPVGDSSVSVQFKKPGNLYLHASIAGCGIADSLLINIKAPIPNVSLGSDTILCQNSIDTLRPTNPYQKYLWQDGSTDSFYVAKDSGTYKLTATDICNNVSSAEIKISYDSSKLSAGGNIELCKLLDTSLTASNGFTGYQWQPANAIIGNALSQTIKIAPAETIAYIVSATSFSGCLLSDTVKVAVEDCLNRLIVPSAFTPNNDGKNDIIKPIVYGVLEKYDFAIYNRWGEIVFRSTKQNEGWNGTINGVLQNEGVYAWFCHYQFVGEKEKISKGTLVLAK